MSNRDHTESTDAESQTNTEDCFEGTAFVSKHLDEAVAVDDPIDETAVTDDSPDDTATFDDSSEHEPFVATCPDCDVKFEASDPNAVLEFFRRHHRHTGHDVVWTKTAFMFTLPQSGDVKSVLSALEPNFDSDGVPVGTLTAAMAEQGYAIGETLDALYDVRMRGNIFEPRADHVRAV